MSTTEAVRTLTIRPLTIEELPLCEPYGKAFHAEKDVPGEFSMEVFLKNWTTFMTHCHGIILGLWDDGRLVGGLGGMLTPDITTGTLAATEFFLYIAPEHRGGTVLIRLINRFREHGKLYGAARLRLALTIQKGEDVFAPRLDSLYRRIGLRPVEIGYDGPITKEHPKKGMPLCLS